MNYLTLSSNLNFIHFTQKVTFCIVGLTGTAIKQWNKDKYQFDFLTDSATEYEPAYTRAYYGNFASAVPCDAGASNQCLTYTVVNKLKKNVAEFPEREQTKPSA